MDSACFLNGVKCAHIGPLFLILSRLSAIIVSVTCTRDLDHRNRSPGRFSSHVIWQTTERVKLVSVPPWNRGCCVLRSGLPIRPPLVTSTPKRSRAASPWSMLSPYGVRMRTRTNRLRNRYWDEPRGALASRQMGYLSGGGNCGVR